MSAAAAEAIMTTTVPAEAEDTTEMKIALHQIIVRALKRRRNDESRRRANVVVTAVVCMKSGEKGDVIAVLRLLLGRRREVPADPMHTKSKSSTNEALESSAMTKPSTVPKQRQQQRKMLCRKSRLRRKREIQTNRISDIQ